MKPEQCQAARKLLGWSRDRFAGQCHLPLMVVEIYERTGRVMGSPLKQSGAERLKAMQDALVAAGVEFTSEAAAGVKMRPWEE